MANHAGFKVYVIELGEVGNIVRAKKNWTGRVLYFVDTVNIKGWGCYANELNFI